MPLSLERISKKRRILASASALSFVAVFGLSGCGYLEKLTPKNDGIYNEKAAAEQRRESNQGYANTMNAMSGAKGITNHAYLTKEVQDSIMQLAQLHQSVSDMQNRMQVVSPSVEKLEEMKQNINALGKKFDQIQMVLHQDAQGANGAPMGNNGGTSAMGWPTAQGPQASKRPMQLMKADTSYNSQPSQSTVAQSYQAPQNSFASQIPQGATGLIDVRVGEHKGKTRIVLDMAKAVDIRYDLDNEQNIMVVELPGSSAANVTSKNFPKSSLLKGYDIQKSGDNTLVIFMFKKPTSILEAMQLKGRGQSAHRFVFDMDK